MTKIETMKLVAMQKAIAHGGNPAYIREIEQHIDVIAQQKIDKMPPIYENLLGLAYLLLAEIKRSRPTESI